MVNIKPVTASAKRGAPPRSAPAPAPAPQSDELRKARTRRANAETPREAFERIARIRINKALNAIRTISYLANRPAYDWAPEDAKRIEQALRDAVDAAMARFRAVEALAERKKATQSPFKFEL